jgi:hypothetical protein
MLGGYAWGLTTSSTPSHTRTKSQGGIYQYGESLYILLRSGFGVVISRSKGCYFLPMTSERVCVDGFQRKGEGGHAQTSFPSSHNSGLSGWALVIVIRHHC